ncbi:uncharacterized protein LOC124360995 [Homalodisca vitripennis]|uniref:uncharacterized protein LOC124360995 n=1 Tax=Homalodisca vitripennis TaxID=197043 RepID=UPI001EEB6389|nr:uncharacterized protein LOC124360995 [Homalodisca vitripennis]
MGDLSTSVSFVSNKLDESNSLMKEIRTDLAAMKRENEELRSQNRHLTCEVDVLKGKVRMLEQYSRKDNVEVSGLPVTQNEDVFDVVRDLGAAVGVDIQQQDISTAHRVPSYQRDRIPSLVVKFVRRATRDKLIENYRQKKTAMTAIDVNPALPMQRIYINEHLSPDNKVFLSKLKTKCKEIGFMYAWCRDGKFFVRKCPG